MRNCKRDNSFRFGIIPNKMFAQATRGKADHYLKIIRHLNKWRNAARFFIALTFRRYVS